MSVTETKQDAVLAALSEPATALPELGGRRAELRDTAGLAIATQQLPTGRDEAYRFLNLAPLKAQTFTAAPAASLETAPAAVAEAGARLVFVDGHFDGAHSVTTGLEAGLTVTTLNEAPEALLAKLGTVANLEADVFTALNSRHLADGALVHVAKDTSVKAPVHVQFVSTGGARASYPRVLVVVETGSRLQVIEEYVGPPGETSLAVGVSEVIVGENASVQHVRVQAESVDAFHIGGLNARVARDGRFETTTFNFGGRTSRLNLDVALTAEGAQTQIRGLTLIGGAQESDTHSNVEHLAPHATSEQVNKAVIAGAAHAVFNGRIRVAKDAQQTNSSQSSRNLLLSDKARVDTKPELEIFADDVKCAHGATVGQLEADEIFYLQSRGLSAEAARSLLTYAFAAEVIDTVGLPSLQERLAAVVLAATEQKTR